MDSVAAWKDGAGHLDLNRLNKKQRTSREDDKPRQLPGPWKIQTKGINLVNHHRFTVRKSPEHSDTEKQRSWEKIFDRLVNYKARHGDSNVPVYFDDRELVAWVAEQRKEYLKGTLPSAWCVRLEELNFEFPTSNGKTKENQNAVPPEEASALDDLTAGSPLAVHAATNLRHVRFGTRPSIKNPYAKPPSRFTCQDPVSQELNSMPRFASTPESQVSASQACSRLATAASKTLSDESNAAPSSPQTILNNLRPHPPTPEMTEYFPVRQEGVAGVITQEATQAGISNVDNISLLSDDRGDDDVSFTANHEAEEESFNNETSREGMLSFLGTLRKRGVTFLLDFGKGGSTLLLRLMLMIQTLRISFGLEKRIVSSEAIVNTEEISTHSNNETDDEGPLNQEDDKDSVTDEILDGEIDSTFTEILRKSGIVFLFFLGKGGSILFFCLMMVLRALGLSIGVGVAMGYLILLGKIDVPAVNDALKVRFGQ